MNMNECQLEMRSAFLGGFAGQLVSGLIWLAGLQPGVLHLSAWRCSFSAAWESFRSPNCWCA